MSNKRKSIFFTSDLHFGHVNCIKYDNRPFRDIIHMNQVLVDNYNSVVPEDGICYFLGDFGLQNMKTLTHILGSMNGTKVLIIGNHDGNVNRMYRMGFDVVLQNAEMIIAGERVTMSHYPLLSVKSEDIKDMVGQDYKEGDNWGGETRFSHLAIENRGQYHLNGHRHNGDKIVGKQYNVSVMHNNYFPVSITTIEKWIQKDKREREMGKV